MKAKIAAAGWLVGWFGFLSVAVAEPAPPELPPPDTSGGRPLMEVLKDRRTTREMSSRPLPLPVLSRLLWAGFGVNRPDGRRTAPSAMNSQEVEIYVALAEGLHRYDAASRQLRLVAAGDLRGATSGQEHAKTAPVVLLYVADLSRLTKAKAEDRERYAWIDTGYISQNVYLFCASEGLASVAFEPDRGRLPELLKLRPEQRLVLAQAVGAVK